MMVRRVVRRSRGLGKCRNKQVSAHVARSHTCKIDVVYGERVECVGVPGLSVARIGVQHTASLGPFLV